MNNYTKNSKNVLHHAKHFFIPHEHNEYKPHIFREASVSVLLGTILFLFGLSVSSAYIMQATEIGKEIISKVLIDITNKNRIENSLPILTENKKLYFAASLKAKDMLDNQYFAHESPSGLKPWYFLDIANYDYVYAGENLAINHTENTQTGRAWMDSPLHRKNILDNNFKEIGISAYSGNYEGRDTVFVVQMFGSPNQIEIEIISPKIIEVKKEVAGLVPEKKLIAKEKEVKKVSNILSEEIKINSEREVNLAEKNESKSEEKIGVLGEQKINYSNTYERLIYSGSDYVKNILQILFIIVFFASLLMIFIEIKKQHLLHIAYAVFLLIILITLMYLNKNYLELNFIYL